MLVEKVTSLKEIHVAEYHRLKAQRERIDARMEHLRGAIIAFSVKKARNVFRLGGFDVVVRDMERRYPQWKAVWVKKYGEDSAQRVIDQTKPITVTSVTVLPFKK